MFKVQVNDAFYNQLEFLLYLNCWTSVSCLAGMKVFTQQHVAVVKGPASVLWSNNYITAECYLTCHKAHSCRPWAEPTIIVISFSLSYRIWWNGGRAGFLVQPWFYFCFTGHIGSWKYHLWKHYTTSHFAINLVDMSTIRDLVQTKLSKGNLNFPRMILMYSGPLQCCCVSTQS